MLLWILCSLSRKSICMRVLSKICKYVNCAGFCTFWQLMKIIKRTIHMWWILKTSTLYTQSSIKVETCRIRYVVSFVNHNRRKPTSFSAFWCFLVNATFFGGSQQFCWGVPRVRLAYLLFRSHLVFTRVTIILQPPWTANYYLSKTSFLSL